MRAITVATANAADRRPMPSTNATIATPAETSAVIPLPASSTPTCFGETRLQSPVTGSSLSAMGLLSPQIERRRLLGVILRRDAAPVLDEQPADDEDDGGREGHDGREKRLSRRQDGAAQQIDADPDGRTAEEGAHEGGGLREQEDAHRPERVDAAGGGAVHRLADGPAGEDDDQSDRDERDRKRVGRN